MEENHICKLCERNVPVTTDHHIIPRSRGGKELIEICKDCHKQLHALFDNKTLEEKLNTIELILANEQFYKYLKWVRTKPYGVVHKAKRSKETRKRGRKG